MNKKLNNITLQNTIKNLVISNHFQWYWNENQINENNYSYFGFTHTAIRNYEINSGTIELIKYLADEIVKKENIKYKAIFRANFNLLTNINITDEQLKNSIHQDTEKSNFFSILYYVINSDGNTILYNDDKETIISEHSPIEGEYIIFKSNTWHRASLPKINSRRLAINIVLELEE
jgi:hypothetical protein